MLPDELAQMLEAKLRAGWTGKITLHIKDGKVIEMEQATKVRIG